MIVQKLYTIKRYAYKRHTWKLPSCFKRVDTQNTFG